MNLKKELLNNPHYIMDEIVSSSFKHKLLILFSLIFIYYSARLAFTPNILELLIVSPILLGILFLLIKENGTPNFNSIEEGTIAEILTEEKDGNIVYTYKIKKKSGMFSSISTSYKKGKVNDSVLIYKKHKKENFVKRVVKT